MLHCWSAYRRISSAIFSRIGRWRKTLMSPRKPSSRRACRLCSVSGSSRRSRLGPRQRCWTSPWGRDGSWCWCWCCTSSHIQERRTDRPPGLEALEVAHAASLHEDNVAAYRKAGSVYGCVYGHGRRIERADHWDGRAPSPGRRVNVIFCRAHVLAECIV